MKREKLNLGEKVAVICEGGAETAIMEMLLDAGRLIFTEEDLFYDEIRDGTVEIIDHYPGGHVSIDVMSGDTLFKHLSLTDVLDHSAEE